MTDLFAVVESDAFLESDSFLQHTLHNGASHRMTTVGGQRIYLRHRGVLEIQPAHQGSSLPPVSAGDRNQSVMDAGPAASVVLSAGIHGNETAPMEILDGLVSDVLHDRLVVTCRLLVIIGNPEAAIAQSRFVEQNLNRLFSGAFNGVDNLEARRAEMLSGVVDDFFGQAAGDKIHYDLHTAMRESVYERFAVMPYGASLDEVQKDFLSRSAIQAILLSNAPATTFSYFSSNTHNADSCTIELGKVRPFGKNDLSRLSSIWLGLRELVSGQPRPPADRPERLLAIIADPMPDRPEIPVYVVISEVLRHCDEGFVLHLEDEVPNFTELSVGYQLTSGQDGGFAVTAPGSAIIFPNAAVPVGQRVALIVQRQLGPGLPKSPGKQALPGHQSGEAVDEATESTKEQR